MDRAEVSKGTRIAITVAVIAIVGAFAGWQEWSYRQRDSGRAEMAVIALNAKRAMECEAIVRTGAQGAPGLDIGQMEDSAGAMVDACREFLNSYRP